MSEKREFPRYSCKIPVKFISYEGNPNKFDIKTAKSEKGKGNIVDISKGGVFILTKSRVNINMPIELKFSTINGKIINKGIIVRTGLIKNNPSEVAQRYAAQKIKSDAYIAIKFDSPIDELSM